MNPFSESTVAVVDDDPRVRKALSRLLAAYDLHVRCYATAQKFLDEHDLDMPGCAIFDLSMPGLNGLDLQVKLAEAGSNLPIIFLTGYGSIAQGVQAMKGGAVDFLTKPADASELIDSVRKAMEKDRTARLRTNRMDMIKEKLATLTPRETEVMNHIVTGQLNKQIAADLGTAEKTIKVHRARVMRKMGVRSVAELVHIADRIGFVADGGAFI